MAAIASPTKYNKKKDVILTPNFQIATPTQTMAPLNWQRYISIVKKEVTELLKKPNYQQSNLTSDERLKLWYLSENRYLTIKGADKGGKIVIMDTADYIEHCGLYYKKMTFSIKNLYSEYDQIHSFLRIWCHLLKKSLMETSFFEQCYF